MNITTRTVTTASDDDLPHDVDLPIQPSPIEEIRISEDQEWISYLADAPYSDDYEWPEGVKFAQSNPRNLNHVRDVDSWLEGVNNDPNLDVFPVGVYEHGLISYSLAGESIHSSDQFDYCIGACIAIPNMNDGKGFTDPKEAARAILQEYTSWCNGEVYLIVRVNVEDPDNYDVVGGFIGLEYATEALDSGDYL